MWHQVKSFGETNMAIAFLFSRFQDRKHLNTSDCPENIRPVRLSDVDVDLQYPGHGLMTMGNSEIEGIREELDLLLDEEKGYITKRNCYRLVYTGHQSGAKNKDLMLQKAKNMFAYLVSLAGGSKQNVTMEFIEGISRAQIRPLYKWLYPIEPANSYDHEYSVFLPEMIKERIHAIKMKNNGNIEKNIFIYNYQQMGGTLEFAENFWSKLAGDQEVIQDVSKTIDIALEKYELYRRNDPEALKADEDAIIITPQGHKSQPKKMRGGYSSMEEDERNAEDIKEEDTDEEKEDTDEEEEEDNKTKKLKNEL